MAKTKVFISFEYKPDLELKENLVAQAGRQDSPFSIADWSLPEEAPEPEWLAKAEARIRLADVMVVMLGFNTHQAPGVLKEVAAAQRLRLPMFQLQSQERRSRAVTGAGPVVVWTWENLQAELGKYKPR
jgi:hypothetical protein